MAQHSMNPKKKPIGKMMFFGVISIALYTVLLVKQGLINE